MGAVADPERSALRLADGVTRVVPLRPDHQVALYSRALHEGRGGLVEVVAGWRQADGSMRMRQRNDDGCYPPAGSQAALVALARTFSAQGAEVFATPLTRERPEPGRGAVAGGWCAWVDIDDDQALERLREFRPLAHLIVRSGSGGAHGYWRFSRGLSGEEIEATNRKLCAALDGDLASTDRGRIMRLPGTFNYKAGRGCQLVWADLQGRGTDSAELVAGLKDPRPPARVSAGRPHRGAPTPSEAERLSPPEYFSALCQIAVPESGGYVHCPVHEERTPSCMVYPSSDRGWHCFGCNRGGGIYDLASLLTGGPWGGELRGGAFRGAKTRVEESLGIGQATGAHQMPAGRPAGGDQA